MENAKQKYGRGCQGADVPGAATAADSWSVRFFAVFNVEMCDLKYAHWNRMCIFSKISTFAFGIVGVSYFAHDSGYLAGFAGLLSLLVACLDIVYDFFNQKEYYARKRDDYQKVLSAVEQCPDNFMEHKKMLDDLALGERFVGVSFRDYAYNVTCRRLGVQKDFFFKIPWYKSLLKNFVDLGASKRKVDE